MTPRIVRVLLSSGDSIMVNVRQSVNGQHKAVVDLFPGGPALCVCMCGATWSEGADVLPPCTLP